MSLSLAVVFTVTYVWAGVLPWTAALGVEVSEETEATRCYVEMKNVTTEDPGGSKESCVQIVSRREWGARLPKHTKAMKEPVSHVVIHHSYQPPACDTMEECQRAMRSMQDFHMDTHHWDDIGYSFAVGGEWVFEGRGWGKVGAHTPGYNNHSVGICFIGDYRVETPSAMMLSLGQSLIECGVSEGHIRPDYLLLGHRQAKVTECPGDALYSLIQRWPHWTAHPEDDPAVTSGSSRSGL